MSYGKWPSTFTLFLVETCDITSIYMIFLPQQPEHIAVHACAPEKQNKLQDIIHIDFWVIILCTKHLKRGHGKHYLYTHN